MYEYIYRNFLKYLCAPQRPAHGTLQYVASPLGIDRVGRGLRRGRFDPGTAALQSGELPLRHQMYPVISRRHLYGRVAPVIADISPRREMVER
jgi:hypothetical protein